MPVGEPQEVVIETVFFVPHLVVMVANPVHGISNPDKVLIEAVSHFFINRVVLGKNESDLQHDLAVERNPCGAVRLFDDSAGGQVGTAIKYANVIQAEKSPGEDVASVGVFAVYPPGEIDQQALETLFQKGEIGFAPLILNLVQK